MNTDVHSPISIWGENIPFNSPDSKLRVMNINYKQNTFSCFIKFILAIKDNKKQKFSSKRLSSIDTYTYKTQIKKGRCSETFEDIPCLTPYLVSGSDRAVIVVPGGGYAAGFFPGKLDFPDNDAEMGLAAKRLNEAGINAFVLSYRYNPYSYPVPFLDMQRAVKFLKFNARKYGIDKNKIGLVGFSAGGYQVGGFINLFMNNPDKTFQLLPNNYMPDKIDKTDDTVNNAAMFYPLLSFENHENVLSVFFSKENLGTNKTREKTFVKSFNLSENINSLSVPQFLSHGTKDFLVNCKFTEKYVNALKKQGGNCKYIPVFGAGHVFTEEKKYRYAFDTYLSWANEQFSNKKG